MNQKESLSINQINQAISALDPQGAFKQVSYNLSTHNILYPSTWWVFIPYGRWGNPLSTPNPSPLENAVLQAIPDGPQNECFIDILNLQMGDGGFFYDQNASQKIVDALSYFINNLPKDVTPIIRYLLGYSTPPSPQGDGFIQDLFAYGKFTNTQAMIYCGNFAPTLPYPVDKSSETTTATESESSGRWQKIEADFEKLWDWLKAEIEKLWHWLVAEIKAYSEDFYEEIKKIEGEIIRWIEKYIHITTIALSWNHAKIFAVNGQNLVTGGANFWPEYATGQDTIFDMAMSVTGDAAVDAHRFAEYFWTYLALIPPWDNKSWCQSTLLVNPKGIAGFTDTHFIPKYSGSPANTGNIPALSVGKSGNWPFSHFGISEQLFDSVRDFILNIVGAIAEAQEKPRNAWIAFTAKLLSDDNPDFRSFLAKGDVNPAAWASRYAKNYAVSQAQQSVRFSQQTFVNTTLPSANPADYQWLVSEIKKHTGVTWDGYLWPYDLLTALGYALSNISNNTTDESTPGAEIVISCATGDYQDATSVAAFKNKLTGLMEGMQLLQYIHPAGTVQETITNLLEFKRISNSTDHGNHAKLVIVDDSVCYIGSDNAYPSYNQEFGLWVDDQPSIQSFITNYWDGLWLFAQPPVE